VMDLELIVYLSGSLSRYWDAFA